MAARTELPVEIRGFKGINLREPEGMVQDDELVECINFDIGRAGELKKRSGFEVLHTGATLGLNSVQLVGHFLTDTYSQIIIQSGSNLYWTTDFNTFNLIGAYTVSYGVQYANKFYMVRAGTTILEWNGAAASAIAGSPSGTFCLVYRDRLFVLSSSATGTLNSRLYFSAIADFSATGWPSTNFIDVRQGDGDFLTCLAVIHDLLLIFKTKSTHALYVQGLPENWVLRSINPEIGCVSKYTPREIEGFLFFVGSRGVYKTDGNIFEDLSSSIFTEFHNRTINLTTTNVDSAAWFDDKYILLLRPDPSTRRYFVYHLRTGGWTQWSPVDGITPAYFLEVHTTSPTKGLYCGDLEATGKIYRYGGTGYTDAGTPYTAEFTTKEFDFGMPSTYKRGKWMAGDFIGSGTVVVNYIVDAEEMSGGNFTSLSRRGEHKIIGPGYFRVLTINCGVTNDSSFTVLGLTLYLHKKRSVVGSVT